MDHEVSREQVACKSVGSKNQANRAVSKTKGLLTP